MGPRLDRWLRQLGDFQRRRTAGTVAHPWQELGAIAAQVDDLAVEGLDSRAAATALVELEHAALSFEARDFRDALKRATSCAPSMPLTGPAAELFNCNRELLIGDVYLVQEGDAEKALPHFRAAVAGSGPATVLIAGNAAINLGICQNLLGEADEALASYQLAREKYELAQRRDKVADALHSIGNAYRMLDRVDDGIQALHQAVSIYRELENHMGIWRATDDLSRAYLVLAGRRPAEREQWVEMASRTSDGASCAGTEVWRTLQDEEGRLADLSDQMLAHTVTRCELASIREKPMDMLGTLALMKGRVRRSRLPVPRSFLELQPEDLRGAFDAGVPWAHFQVVAEALKLLANGRTIALLDQLAMRGNELVMGYAILGGGDDVLGGFHGGLPERSVYDPSFDFRGRRRGDELAQECQDLVNAIASHSNRCSMVVPADPASTDGDARGQLEEWARELEPALRRLGEVFFPPQVLEQFRARGVQHVVLCIDPLFPRLPYAALIGDRGPILDEPWSLSLVTASTELTRILDRQNRCAGSNGDLSWFGPDRDVNENRGGDAELRQLMPIVSLTHWAEGAATLEALVAALSDGRWCHFRGHGRWTESVRTSGLVLAGDRVLSSDTYPQVEGPPGYLFAAACLTNFGEAVGVEAVGSLVDYDLAGLLGAVLTNWPIHGDAATLFTTESYEELRRCGDAAVAVKAASQRTRASLPHPYLWAPFVPFGAWSVVALLRFRTRR
ncbi:MAG: CHAT domain-containing protein [Gemmataceae bacterium]|nr:CHAT domain-containing protein [Gemmataceae bacterium]